MALNLFPDGIRLDTMRDRKNPLPRNATAEKAEQFFESAVGEPWNTCRHDLR